MWNTRSITVQFHIGLQLFAYEVYFCLRFNLVLQLQTHVSHQKHRAMWSGPCFTWKVAKLCTIVQLSISFCIEITGRCMYHISAYFKLCVIFSITAHVHVAVFVGIITDFLTYKSATFNHYNSFYTIERRFLFFKALFLNKSTSII